MREVMCGKKWKKAAWCIFFFLGLAVGILFLVLYLLFADEPDYNLQFVNATAVSDAGGRPDVFVDAKQLHEWMNSDRGVTLLDARDDTNVFISAVRQKRVISGSVAARWTSFAANGGILKSVPTLQTLFASRGVSNDVPVVVFGGWEAQWGEEGRVFWSLKYLGHKDVHILYGGIWGWLDSGLDVPARFSGPPAVPGDFVVEEKPELRYTSDEILQLLTNGAPGSLVIIDARAEFEYNGATPYGSDRGGHIIEAETYHWKNVFDKDGNIRPATDLQMEFAALGVTREGTEAIATYCTKGVRSGFMWSVLWYLGYGPSLGNYDGSWYHWARNSSLPIDTGSN